MEDKAIEPSAQVVDAAEVEQQEYILSTPISPRRRDAFLEDFVKSREEASTTRALFQWAGRYREAQEFDSDKAYGVNTLLMKGPFVERSNWFSYQTWEFALGMERHILGKLTSNVKQFSQQVSNSPVKPDWTSILDGFDELSREVPFGNRLRRSVLIVAGGLESSYSRVTEGRLVPEWDLPQELRRTWILGLYHERPIVHAREADPAIYIVDIPSFGSLVRYGQPEFELRAIDPQRAGELLDRYPDLVSPQPGRPDTREERMRELQLRVQVRLYESMDIELQPEPGGCLSLLRTP